MGVRFVRRKYVMHISHCQPPQVHNFASVIAVAGTIVAVCVNLLHQAEGSTKRKAMHRCGKRRRYGLDAVVAVRSALLRYGDYEDRGGMCYGMNEDKECERASVCGATRRASCRGAGHRGSALPRAVIGRLCRA